MNYWRKLTQDKKDMLNMNQQTHSRCYLILSAVSFFKQKTGKHSDVEFCGYIYIILGKFTESFKLLCFLVF